MAGLEPSWNGDVALATLQPAPVFPELYQELWWYSGSVGNGNVTTSGSAFAQKGAGGSASSISSATKLFTLSSNWSASTKCAFEIAFYTSNASYTAYVALWDMTSNAIVSASQLSTMSTTATVTRSGQFTLTPGHQYGVTAWSSGAACDFTDASLIIFPSSPLTSPSVSAISLANPSGNGLKEAYIPLWVTSSGVTTLSGGAQALGTYWIRKGTTSPSFPIDSTMKLITLSSSWLASQKFAFEASFYNGTSGDTAQVELWDTTSNTAVASSLVSTTSNTATLVRSGSFTLIPGHSYGVTIGQTAGSCSLTKAHLVALA